MSANNIFRFTGDLLHAASHGILIEKIRSSGSCTGISLKTQLLYGIVFSSRYFDLLWNFGSLYNTILKIYYLATTFYTIYLIAFKHADTYEQQLDKLPLWTIVVPSVLFSLIFTKKYRVFEIFWTFSLIIESMTLLPQFLMLQKSSSIQSFSQSYVVVLGLYRAFYILNWIYRAIKGVNVGFVVWTTGIIQVAMFSEFFYYWIKAKLQGEQMQLPK
ncbi:ER lumen protein retaining receptor [Spironucleus salmonicida]|uniref:ER lumen protein retaining receptor n=1 Tax=Spironucleus salmonicida TaxID=348837 RepID=V6LSX3_9EUKA|nr:ER lumen protein retaining receptor [Spironucleus salmonicida]|eukprot:EST47747.1 ER lumen protein retaining receptor [Spironucleus salmonicida]